MPESFIQDQTFDKSDFTESRMSAEEYDNCIFNNCNFAGTDLSGIKLIDCEFNGCNLSLAKLGGTVLRDIKFRNCKMLGLRFDDCSDFGMSFSFEGCQLNHSSFYKTKIKKTIFKDCDLQEIDFTGADLTSAALNNCNLLNANFDGTLLEKADFRTAYNYSIDPEKNKLKKAKFSMAGIAGLLDKYDIEIEQ
jgi:fluoroquinolone resistance protein